MKPLKIKINPLYVFLAFVACLPFIAVYIGRRAQDDSEVYRRMTFDWISVELPGRIHEARANRSTGMQWLTASDDKRVAVVALLPANPDGTLAQAFDRGAATVAEEFAKLFPTERMKKLDAHLEAAKQIYILSGRREQDNWHMTARLARIEAADKPFIIVVMAIAPRELTATETAEHVFTSIAIQASLLPEKDI